MIELVGFGLSVAGATLVAAGIIGRPVRRGSGLSPSMIEALCIPEYEMRARIYCKINGVPVEEWRRFASQAIGDIIMERRQ